MPHKIPRSELPVTAQGRIYHLNILPEELADTIITVGDPERVSHVTKYFDSLEFKGQHRGFVVHTGYFNKQRMTVLSTGIGAPNIDIVMNELDALANIDFVTGEIRDQRKSLKIIRIGTAGGLQKDIALGDYVVNDYAVGLDGLLHYYQLDYTAVELDLLAAFIQNFAKTPLPLKPYVIAGDARLLQAFQAIAHTGITVTCAGFFGPQNRILRGPVSHPNLIHDLNRFNHKTHRVANFEMETSAIYGLGRVLQHHCCSISAIIANRITKTFSKDVDQVIDKLIQAVLARV